MGWVDDAVAGVYGGEVDLGDELDGRGLIGVVVAAVHLDAVDAVLVDALFLRLSALFLFFVPSLFPTAPEDGWG